MKTQLCWGNSLSKWSRAPKEGCGAVGSASAVPGTHLVMDSSSFLTENTEIKWYPQRIIGVQILTACVTLTPSHSRSHFPVIKQSVLNLASPAVSYTTDLGRVSFPNTSNKLQNTPSREEHCYVQLKSAHNPQLCCSSSLWELVFSPSQICSAALLCISFMFLSGEVFRSPWNTSDLEKKVNCLCFNSSLCKQSPRFREQVLAKDIYQFRRLARLVYRKPEKIKIIEKQISVLSWVLKKILKAKNQEGKCFSKCSFMPFERISNSGVFWILFTMELVKFPCVLAFAQHPCVWIPNLWGFYLFQQCSKAALHCTCV